MQKENATREQLLDYIDYVDEKAEIEELPLAFDQWHEIEISNKSSYQRTEMQEQMIDEVAHQSNKAFEAAIAAGHLSINNGSENFVGMYMFMGKLADGTMQFKHINTRKYNNLKPE